MAIKLLPDLETQIRIAEAIENLNTTSGDLTQIQLEIANIKADYVTKLALDLQLLEKQGIRPNGTDLLVIDGKINSVYIDSLYTTDIEVVETVSDMLSLPDMKRGDMVVVTDTETTYILKQDPSNDIDNWAQLLTKPDVVSVNGKTGVVVLGISDIDNLQALLNSKVDKIDGKGLSTNDYTDYYKREVDDYANSHKVNVSNPHKVTKAQIGLGNVPNKDYGDEVTLINNEITDLQNDKVDKIDGKGLSTNDYTDYYKGQLDEYISRDLKSWTDYSYIWNETTNQWGRVFELRNDLDPVDVQQANFIFLYQRGASTTSMNEYGILKMNTEFGTNTTRLSWLLKGDGVNLTDFVAVNNGTTTGLYVRNMSGFSGIQVSLLQKAWVTGNVQVEAHDSYDFYQGSTTMYSALPAGTQYVSTMLDQTLTTNSVEPAYDSLNAIDYNKEYGYVVDNNTTAGTTWGKIFSYEVSQAFQAATFVFDVNYTYLNRTRCGRLKLFTRMNNVNTTLDQAILYFERKSEDLDVSLFKVNRYDNKADVYVKTVSRYDGVSFKLVQVLDVAGKTYLQNTAISNFTLHNVINPTLTDTDINNLSGQVTEPTLIPQTLNSNNIPSKTSDLTNDSDYTTKAYVDSEIANVDIDLSDYIKNEDIKEVISGVSYNTTNHKITFSRYNDVDIVVDLPIENLLVGLSLNGDDLVLELEDGTTTSVPLNTLLVGVVKKVNGKTPNSSGVVNLSYNDLNDLPDLFSGNYNDLTNKPELFSKDYNDLINLPSLFSGNYQDLINKPELFSKDYNDLINKPIIPSKTSDLTNDSNFTTTTYVDNKTTIKEQNNNTNIKFWTGSQAEFISLSVKDENTIYFIEEE